MEWYYAGIGGQVGPISEEEFQSLANDGTIKSKTMVWNSTMTDWQEYGKIRESDLGAATGAAGAMGTIGESICAECGNAFSQEDMIRYGDSWVCAACKPVFVQKLKEGVSLAGEMEYAGFWIRFGAKVIDGIIMWVINTIITMAIGVIVASVANPSRSIISVIIPTFFQLATAAAYTTWFLGRYGATLGKMACKIKVVTAEGDRVSYLRAFGRHFAEFLSGIILGIGYLMAAFDDQKRTLHDRICNTRVIKK